MRFRDTATNSAYRFSIGREVEAGQWYLSIPVSNSLCDYEEYYVISEEVHDAYPGNMGDLVAFADECRARLHDDLLLLKPGGERGV